MHWGRIDKKIQQVWANKIFFKIALFFQTNSVVESITTRCENREAYDQIEPVLDLVNKTIVGFEIKDDNEVYKKYFWLYLKGRFPSL